MKNPIIVLTPLFIFSIFALTDPMDALMTSRVQMTMLVVAVILYSAIAGLIYKQAPKDEREAHILNQSSKHAFLAGTTVLVIGIIIQSLNYSLDSWLVWSLGVMVITKTISILKNS